MPPPRAYAACKALSPRFLWPAARKVVTSWQPPARVLPIQKRKNTEAVLPWGLPKPMSAEAHMWADYRAFKAAGMLQKWFELYRYVLNLPSEPIAA